MGGVGARQHRGRPRRLLIFGGEMALTRRKFFTAAVAAGGAAAGFYGARLIEYMGAPPAAPWKALTPDEAAVLDALAEEIIPADSGYAMPVVASRYGNDVKVDTETTTLSDELLAVNIRYKEPDASESQLRTYPVTRDMLKEEMDADTSFAAGVAEFGMLLRKSEYSGTASYQEIYDRLKVLPGVMDDEFKTEFLYMVQKVSK